MNLFKVIYYPNSDCHPFILAKSILVFDEMTFFDHPSLTFKSVGTVGHDSGMRRAIPHLEKEGYQIRVLKPSAGPVENELERIIDADLKNPNFRKTFLKLIKNDPSFLMSKVPNGNYGVYGTAENYRAKFLQLRDVDIPMSSKEISSFKVKHSGIPPEINVALSMAVDSFNFNLSSYFATEHDLQLFGDNKGMDMLLSAKLSNESGQLPNEHISHMVAFTLLENLIPNEAFNGKHIEDIVHFRNKMEKDRKKFQERILQMTIDISKTSKKGNVSMVDKILYKQLLPEARNYQNLLARNWDIFFKESTKSIVNSTGQITQIMATSLPYSFAAALLVGAAKIGVTILPHLVDYLKNKEALNRENPYTYLMKFK